MSEWQPSDGMTQAQQDTWDDLLADQARDAQIARDVFRRLADGAHILDIDPQDHEAASTWLDVELLVRNT